MVKGFGSALVSRTKRLLAALRSPTDRKTPQMSRLLVSLAKKVSTADLLEVSDTFCLDFRAFRLPFFALNANYVLFRNVVLLGFAIDGSDHDLGQLDALHEGVEKDDRIFQGDAVGFFLVFVFHHLFTLLDCTRPRILF
jgi:hypothetical protein